ncbi:MAG: DUF1428 domain-containing protein [archaeon]
MTYVDGFVIPIKKDRVSAYKRMAIFGKKAWMKHGAVDYFECVSDDLRVKKGMGQGFKKMAKLKNNEAVIFSFIVFKSRAHRDEVNKKVMSEMKKHMTKKDMAKMGEMMDMKRFSYGGFKTIVQA